MGLAFSRHDSGLIVLRCSLECLFRFAFVPLASKLRPGACHRHRRAELATGVALVIIATAVTTGVV